MNSNTKKISASLSYLAAIACFFLPFMEITCSQVNMTFEVSGYALATGTAGEEATKQLGEIGPGDGQCFEGGAVHRLACSHALACLRFYPWSKEFEWSGERGDWSWSPGCRSDGFFHPIREAWYGGNDTSVTGDRFLWYFGLLDSRGYPSCHEVKGFFLSRRVPACLLPTRKWLGLNAINLMRLQILACRQTSLSPT